MKEADALSEAGHDVHVVAADYVGWARQADAEFEGRPWSRTILRFGPQAPLRTRLRQAATRETARVLTSLGVHAAPCDLAACHALAPDLLRAAVRIRADLYVAHYVAALPAAAAAARRHHARYAYDAEDFHLGDLSDDSAHFAEKDRIRRVEGRYLAGCAYVTAASPGIADALKTTYALPPPLTILNVFPRADAALRQSEVSTAAAGPSVYWFSQTIGADRGLECAIRAIAIAQSAPHLYLRGTISESFAECLFRLAGESGVADRLHILPPASPKDMIRLASVHDVGLVGETGETLNRRIALTNKQFTYFLAGLPVLMTDVPAHADFARDVGAAVQLYPVDDERALARRMDFWFLDEGKLEAARDASRKLGHDRFNWDIEKEKLIDIIARLAPETKAAIAS